MKWIKVDAQWFLVRFDKRSVSELFFVAPKPTAWCGETLGKAKINQHLTKGVNKMKKCFLATIIFLLPLVLHADTLFLSNGKSYEGTVTKWDAGKISFVMKDAPLSSAWEVPSERIDKIVIDDGATYLPFNKYWLNQNDTIYAAKLKEVLSRPSDNITAEDLKLLALLKCYRGAEVVNISSAQTTHPAEIKTITSIPSSIKKDKAPYVFVSAVSLILAYDFFSDAGDLRDGANSLPDGEDKDRLTSEATGHTVRGVLTLAIGILSFIVAQQ
ncbi:MAG: hypothetical protein KJ620_00830 [Candidatus Edwardsbacteria bacterium]|nr:hypothetical protein [Candidatus Edwardsbacteria bacterium]MBU1576460.1 hypothetical protein [Candidatus Edwardsbacteria bacterium]MBU2464481.1 hypothetical protein [Candidatus Edwardsbacteria bacterium]